MPFSEVPSDLCPDPLCVSGRLGLLGALFLPSFLEPGQRRVRMVQDVRKQYQWPSGPHAPCVSGGTTETLQSFISPRERRVHRV